MLRDSKYTHAVVWSPDELSSFSKKELYRFKTEYGFNFPDFGPFIEVCVELARLAGMPMDAKLFEPRWRP